MLVPWNKSNGKPRQHFKKQRHHFANKGPYSQSYGFSGSHVWMWELCHTEGWSLKNWSFCTVMLKTLEGSLDSQEIKPINARENQSWIFIGRSDAEAEAPIIWTRCWEPTLCWLIFLHFFYSLEKTLMLWKIEGRRRRGQQRMKWLGGIIDLLDMSLSNSKRYWRVGKSGMLQSTGS